MKAEVITANWLDLTINSCQVVEITSFTFFLLLHKLFCLYNCNRDIAGQVLVLNMAAGGEMVSSENINLKGVN